MPNSLNNYNGESFISLIQSLQNLTLFHFLVSNAFLSFVMGSHQIKFNPALDKLCIINRHHWTLSKITV